MNLELYLATLERTVQNLPGVIDGCDDIPDSLVIHYLEELTNLEVMENSAKQEAESIGRPDLALRIEAAVKKMVAGRAMWMGKAGCWMSRVKKS